MDGHQEKVGFIWSVADLLRGDFKQSEYGKVILPFTVLRRLDCVLEPTKDAVLTRAESLSEDVDAAMRDTILNMAAGQSFHNLSRFTFERLKSDPDHIGANLHNYVNGFPEGIREIFIDRFKLTDQIDRLDAANLLYLVLGKFCEIDLHPERVSNLAMGYVFEELIRRFSEQSNETAGEHFTPREVIRLMVNLLFIEDRDALSKPGVIRDLYDPACGTGGMLSVAQEYLHELNPDAALEVFGQELNGESYAVCKSDMLIKGANPGNVKYGNSFSDDQTRGSYYNYMLSNPPFGVEWKKVEKAVRDEHENQGLAGRFGVGLPRVSDGSLLFVQHMISKFKRDGTASRIAVVLNGSPLFTGSAGSGESEIRRWIIENDWLEAIVGLPNQLFYNTGISTYIWIISNQKPSERRGKVQLINAVDCFEKMRKSLGNKRNQVSQEQIDLITRTFGDFVGDERSKVFDNEDFGFWRITVERPLRLNFQVSPERIAQVKEQSAFQHLAVSKKKGVAGEKEVEEGRALQAGILAVLEGMQSDELVLNRGRFSSTLKRALKDTGLTLPAPVFKAVLIGLSERDENADICMVKGEPEPDPELRDYENIHLKDNIRAYFEREVLPHVPDAWIDESKTRKGYEIPFTRHFYQYVSPRPLEAIDAELKELSVEIQTMLQEVVS